MRRTGNAFWGVIFLALAAALILNQMNIFFITFSLWDILLAIIALKLTINMFAFGTIANLPLAVGLIYIVMRNQGFVTHISTGTIFSVAILSSLGLSLLFPQRRWWQKDIHIGTFSSGNSNDWNNGDYSSDEIRTDNNPKVNITFGSTSRYLFADALESAKLSCTFGGMDVYFDQVQLHENGATVYVECTFGGMDLYVPRHWNVVEQVNSTFGGVDIARRIDPLTEGAPTLTIVGSSTFGGIDVHYV